MCVFFSRDSLFSPVLLLQSLPMDLEVMITLMLMMPRLQKQPQPQLLLLHLHLLSVLFLLPFVPFLLSVDLL